MPITKQLIPVSFAQGLDDKTDPYQVAPGKLLDLVNAQFTQQGAISKRSGYDVLPRGIEGGGAISAAQAISSYGGEMLLFTGERVYSHMSATATWIDRGNATSIIVSERQILRQNDFQQLNPDVAYLNGVEVYAWEDESGAVRYSVVDADTGTFAVSNGLVAEACIKPRLTTFQGRVVIIYTDGVNNLFYRLINPFIPTQIGPQQTLVGDMAFYSGLDVLGTADRLFFAYVSPGGPFLNLASVDSNFANLTTTVVASDAGVSDGTHSAVDLCEDDVGNVWVSWSSGTAVWTASYALAGSLLLSPVTVAIVRSDTLTGVVSTDSQTLLLSWEEHATADSNHLTRVATIDLTGAVVAVGVLRSVGLASRGFAMGAQRYVSVAHGSTFQSTYFTVNITPSVAATSDGSFPVVAKEQDGLGGGLRTNGTVSGVVAAEARTYLWANGTRGKVITEANTAFSLIGVNATRLQFNANNSFLSATQSNNLHFVGGVLSNYDGLSVTEHGFFLYPEDVTAVPSGSDGHLSAGQYQYCVTYEWTDNWGQIHRSSASVPTPVTASVNNHVLLTIPTLRVTAKRGNRSPPSIVIYRTTVNGTLFFRVTDTLAPLLSDPTVDTVQYVDVLADADIISTELVYTTGGVLNNVSPPSSKFIVLYEGRLVLGGLEDPNLLWYSKNKFDNSNQSTIPVEFAAELRLGCDARGGSITGLGVLDDKLIIFKQHSIFAVSGDGPNDTGLGTQFPDPAMVTSDVGCNNPNSIVVTPAGLMFQSEKGIYLLDRSASAQYIGAPVESHNSQVVTSATLSADTNQVIFTCAEDPALVYDYLFDQWSTWTNHVAADADVFGSGYSFVRPNGQVYVRNQNIYTDGGKAVLMGFVTPNYSFSGLSGFQRVFRCFVLGKYKSPHKLTISVAYDYSKAYTQAVIFDAAQDQTTWGSDATWGALGSIWGGTGASYAYRVDFARQRCTAMRLSVQESQGAEKGEGYSMSAITFEVGAMPGGNRLGPKRQLGVKS